MSSEVTIGSISTASLLSTEVFWKIEHFLELPKNRFYCTVSPAFQFRGQDWKLKIWPNSFVDFIPMDVLRKGPVVFSPSQVVRCHVGLKHGDGADQTIIKRELRMEREHSEWDYEVRTRAFPRSFLRKEREVFLPSGRLTFFFKLSVKEDLTGTEVSTQTEDIDHVLATLSQNLKDLYMARKDCDVTIKVKDETFSAHRAILGARTPVLAAMFSHRMAERETGVICVEDCDPRAFAVFLLFVYSGDTEKLTSNNVISVYYIADKYDLPDLKKACIWYMLSNLTIDTICEVLEIAERHGEMLLLEKAIEFFQKNAQAIFPTTEWERFMVENAPHAKELIIISLKHANAK